MVDSPVARARHASAYGGRSDRVRSITSADRLHAGWSAAQRARAQGRDATAHIERLLAPLPPHCAFVTVIDGHPATLAWLGAVHGHRAAALGVERFGQTGTIADLYRANGIDADGIAARAEALTRGRRMRVAG